MADYEIAASADRGMNLRKLLVQDGSGADSLGANYWRFPGGDAAAAPVTIYKMRGKDALIVAYDTWLVTGEPDHDASEYAGPLATPLRDVVIIDSWIA